MLTNEDIDLWEKQLIREENFLISHSWIKTNDGCISPDDNTLHSFTSAYEHLIYRLLVKIGWKRIVLIREVTFGLNSGKVTKTTLMQSPHTKRIYNFLEALSIFEGDLVEPQNFAKGFTSSLNEVLKNFTGDTIHTQYVKENDEIFHKLKSGEILYQFE